jgi:hypothetical protein
MTPDDNLYSEIPIHYSYSNGIVYIVNGDLIHNPHGQVPGI